jgi:WD40 repeat protein
MDTREYPARIALVVLIVIGFAIVFLEGERQVGNRSVSIVAISSSSKLFAAGSPTGEISVWTTGRTALPEQFRSSDGELNDIQFSPDEHWLVIANRNLRTYKMGDLRQSHSIRSDGDNYGSVRFQREGKTLLVITGTGSIETVDFKSGKPIITICCSTIYGEVALTPNDAMIVNAGHWPGLWDVSSGRLVARLTESRQVMTFRPIGFDQTAANVYMGSQDGRVYRWDFVSRRLLGRSPAQENYVDALAVIRTGWVAYAGYGKPLRLWDPETSRTRSIPEAMPTSNLIVDADGKSVIFGTAVGTIEVWDTTTGHRTEQVAVPRIKRH